MEIETIGKFATIILAIIETAAFIGFLLVFWWMYRAVWQIATDIRHIRDKVLPPIEGRLLRIASNTDPD